MDLKFITREAFLEVLNRKVQNQGAKIIDLGADYGGEWVQVKNLDGSAPSLTLHYSQREFDRSTDLSGEDY